MYNRYISSDKIKVKIFCNCRLNWDCKRIQRFIFDLKKWINNKRFKNGLKDTIAEFRNNYWQQFWFILWLFLNSSDISSVLMHCIWYPRIHFGSSRLDKTVGQKISFQNRQKLGFTYRSRNQCPPTVYHEKKSAYELSWWKWFIFEVSQKII